MVRDIGREFMEKTQYKYLATSDQNKGLPQPPLELTYDKSKRVINLPSPSEVIVPTIDLRRSIEDRKSIREYSNDPLTLMELSWLLWCTQGVKEIVGTTTTLRNVPSAGARHAFETYILVNRVEGLKPGLYRFLAMEHKLLEYNLEEVIADKITEACYRQGMVKRSAATFIWSAVVYRMYWRYGERGYRYLHLDAGHICQNLYLAAEAIRSGACAIGAYYDDEINRALSLDTKEQFVIYVATVGKKNR